VNADDVHACRYAAYRLKPETVKAIDVAIRLGEFRRMGRATVAATKPTRLPSFRNRLRDGRMTPSGASKLACTKFHEVTGERATRARPLAPSRHRRPGHRAW